MPKYCNRICMAKGFSKPPIKKICLLCKKGFDFRPWNGGIGKFCSLKCIQGNPEHLKQYRKNNPVKSFWVTASNIDRFEKLNELYEERVIKNEQGCWSWKRKTLTSGYGKICTGRGKIITAHRLSYLIHKGDIPEGLFILHKCHNPICSNPEHLYIGNHKDNTRDMLEADRGNFNKQKSKNAKLNREQIVEIKQLLKII